jgi:hypothetical protein
MNTKSTMRVEGIKKTTISIVDFEELKKSCNDNSKACLRHCNDNCRIF